MKRNIPSEWHPLRRVIVGHGRSMGPEPTVDSAYDPTSRHHLRQGTYPTPDQVEAELDGLASAMKRHGVDVLRPVDTPDLNQVFARDVGMVIGDQFFRANMIEDRSAEWSGIQSLIDDPVTLIPDDVRMEGGDVLVLPDALVVGVTRDPDQLALQTARTHASAVPFLKSHFPDREVLTAELHKNDQHPVGCSLHLDCAYMPLGGGQAILCREAFRHEAERLAIELRHTDIVAITPEEAALLQSNLLHLAPDTLLIDPRFRRLAGVLEQWDYTLVPISMEHVGRMGGLFRCSTLPLLRAH